MPFQTLTSDGLSIVCFLIEHDWTQAPELSLYYPGSITRGLSNREGRRPDAEAALLDAHLRLFFDDEAEAQALRQAFATLGSSWVGVPVLVDTFLGADVADSTARALHAQRLIDLTAPAIVAHDAALEADHLYAPLLVGHITVLPPLEPQGAYIVCSAIFTEDSPWEFRFGAMVSVSTATFPAALVPEWTKPPQQTPVKELDFDRVGFQREQAIGGLERAFFWTQEAGFTLVDKTELATLIGFFLACRGTWTPFDAPFWWAPGTPTAEAPHSSKCRFAEPSLKLSFTTTHVASVRLKLVQVPWEIVGTAGETPQQPARVHLYRFRYDLPEPIYFRFTNCWRPLTRADDGVYTPAPFLHGEINESCDLEGDELTLQSFAFTGNPLQMFNPRTLEGRLWLEVFEIETDPLDPAAAVSVWQGTIARAPQKGRAITAEGKWLGGLLDRELPGVRIQPSCNVRMFSAPCGLLKSAFAKAGTLTSSVEHVVELAASDAAAASTYAPGWIEVGAGATWELRSIVGSEPITGGQRLVLDAPLRQAAAGQAVTYYRSCDGSAATCKVLGNFARFRGHPGLPRVNLSIPSYTQSSAGKK